MGPFNSMFDFNGDGKLRSLEQACEFQFMDDLINSDYQDDCENESFDLEMTGLDSTELERMSRSERRKVLLNAGLNPDEFDF